MYINFIKEYEEDKERLYQFDEMLPVFAEWLKEGKGYCDFTDEYEYDDWYYMDMVAIDVASKMGWDYSEYKNDNTFEEFDEDALQLYNDERMDILGAALDYIDSHINEFSDKTYCGGKNEISS